MIASQTGNMTMALSAIDSAAIIAPDGVDRRPQAFLKTLSTIEILT